MKKLLGNWTVAAKGAGDVKKEGELTKGGDVTIDPLLFFMITKDLGKGAFGTVSFFPFFLFFVLSNPICVDLSEKCLWHTLLFSLCCSFLFLFFWMTWSFFPAPNEFDYV